MERSYSRSIIQDNEISLVKDTYKLFAATMISGAVGAFIAIPYTPVILEHALLLTVSWFISMFAVIFLQNKPFVNLLSLFVFTFIGGLFLGPHLTKLLATSNGGLIIGNAFLGTSALFLSLSYFAIKTKKDFTSLGKPLLITLLIAIVLSLINAFFLHMPLLYIAIEVVLLFVFALLVIYDTQMILTKSYTPIEGAVNLYLDFLNIFIIVLDLLGIYEKD